MSLSLVGTLDARALSAFLTGVDRIGVAETPRWLEAHGLRVARCARARTHPTGRARVGTG